MHRKVFSILFIVIFMAVLFALPGFGETQQELKERFVTRAEWSEWIYDNCGIPEATDTLHNPIGMSEYLANIEEAKVISVYNKVGKEMSLRGIRMETTE